MKPKYGDVSQSCSCTTCTFKSESDRPSFRNIIAQGSRVDKLYLGKYIPLRERKLLGKLVRTRAIYDDIRTQLLSDSDVSINEKANLKPRKNLPSARKSKELDDDVSRSVILELVDIIDKGAALGSRKLSECCSCCSCGSTIPLHDHESRVHRHGRAHISSRSSISGHRAKDDRRKGRQLRPKAKHISSDPCTCTAKLSGLIKRESKALIKNLRGKKTMPKFEPPFEVFDESRVRSGRISKGTKYKQIGMGETMRKSLTKVRESKTRIANKLKSDAKKSLEAIKNAEHKVKSNIEESVKKKIHKGKPDVQEQILTDDEIVFNAVRDSVTKYREDMEKKALLKDWECNFPCDPEECDPEECIRIIKKTRLRKNNANRAEMYQKNTENSNASDEYDKIHAENLEMAATTVKKTEDTNKTDTTGIIDDNKEKRDKTTVKQTKNKNAKVQDKCLCENTGSKTAIKTKSVKSNTSLQQKNSKVAESSQKKTSQRHRKPFNTSTNIENNARSLALRRCICTLKLKSKPPKKVQEIRRAVSKSLQTINMSQSHDLLPYECEPMVCIPGECDPIECEKRIRKNGIHVSSMIKKDANVKSRSTPSLTSKSVSNGETKNLKTYNIEKARSQRSKPIIDLAKTPRQAVRISSNFSFSIEFYKNQGKSDGYKINSRPSLKTQSKSTKSKHFGSLAHKSSQNNSSGKSKYTTSKHNLRRCFCTLKLAKLGKRNKVQSRSKGTLTPQQSLSTTNKSLPQLMDRSTEKRGRKVNVKNALLPYECEPGICVPGECNPYKCLELINQRKGRTRSRHSGTDQLKTKSTYSISRKNNKHAKTVHVQSISSSQKNERITPKRKHRETILSSGTHKQAVRIGSKFNFNIEFYKETSPSTGEIALNQVKLKAATKGTQSQGHAMPPSHQKSTSAHVVKKEKEVLAQSNMKGCFCTLKLRKVARNKNKIKLRSTGTETTIVKEKMYPRMEMSTEIKKMYNIERQLAPYECEPNFCVPYQCDPNRCLKRIKSRNQVKSKEFGTVTHTPNRKSTSSATKTNKKAKDAISQFHRQAKPIKQYNFTPPRNNSRISTDILQKSSTRQAVRIGSNFSFNVEFSKDLPSNNYSFKESGNGKSKTLKHKGENYSGKPGKQGITQTLVNKSSKSSSVRPILKRCFCTLRLQNNKNRKKIPTVMPVLIQNAFSTLNKDELMKLRELLVAEKNRSHSSGSYSSMLPSSYTESSHYSVHKGFKSCQQSSIHSFGVVVSNYSKSMITKVKHQNTFIGINQYLKSSFYAMNIQVQNKQRRAHKLEPYECEPGICTPGECDPIECQKLIMKRLRKGVSTMASTEKRSQSISSNGTLSKSKRQQYNNNPAVIPRVEKEQQGFKYKTLPRANKNVVRVGSSFSFNIEFSKDKKPAEQVQALSTNTNTNTSKSVSRNTRSSQVLRQHRTSQSAVAMQDRGSNVAPKIKRCFCTLKIQKKGRQNKALHVKEKINKQDIMKTVDVGQNTKKYKPHISISDLDPNECEPGVCVPGECDPYECLERIKRRGVRTNTKDFGTGYMNQQRMSSSQTKVARRKQSKQTNFKQKPVKTVKAAIEKKNIKPSRQVVRIGSSFSFDVEFFKDKSLPTELNIATPLSSKTRANKLVKSQKAEIVKNMKQKGIQDSKLMRHGDSQVELPAHHEKSTKTGSFLQRCFCTANLHKKQNSTASSPFVKRVLKSFTTAKTNASAKPLKSESTAIVQTKKIKEKRQKQNKLDPNECEPGVCVPGECNPLICIERIRKRNANLDKMSSTESSGTRTTSTDIRPSRTSKTKGSKAHFKKKSNKKKPHVKQQRISRNRSKPSGRSVVRIGSNFSFNVEFYKERNPTFENVQKAIKEIKQHRAAVTKCSNVRCPNSKAKGVDRAILSHNNTSQVDHVKKENKSSDFGPMLKRCFCTLSLQKQVEKEGSKLQKGIKIEKFTRATETPGKYKSKPYHLEPYECEPGVCVPGQCDPYECEKRIKKRQRRDSGTETMKQTSKSATTFIKDSKKHKNKNNQALQKYKKSTDSKGRVPMKRIPISSKGHAKQAVRIGSSFSFNIDFSKSRTSNDLSNDFNDNKPVKRTKMRTDSTSQSAGSRDQKTQDKKNIHDAYSQVLAKKVRSTLTEMAPLLKRCFCTLTLKNDRMAKKDVKLINPTPKKVENIKPTISQVHKVINTDKPKKYPRTLDPNECEPGTCVPGKCDPRQCLKRIQRRMQTKFSNTYAARVRNASITTSKPDISSAKTTTGIKRRREAGDSLRTEKRRPSQSPTNSNKQVVRIGSNFSFNIEFFKDSSMVNANAIHSPKPEKKHKKQIQCNQKTCHAVSSNPSKLVNRKLQSHETESKASGQGPLMKRCFCTLKLQKVGKLHEKVPKPIRTTKDNSATAKIKTKIDDSRISKNATTVTKKKRRALEPYECEPNTCIPGQCNPLECYEKIKLRNLNEFGTDTERLSMMSVGSLTDGKAQLKKNQTPIHKTGGTKSSNYQTKGKPERSSNAADRNRQSVRLGSSFKFDIEFYKEASQKGVNNVKYETHSTGDTRKKNNTKPIKTSSQGSFGLSPSANHRAQQAYLEQKSVGSGIAPLLKRCFCTLTLHHTETNKKVSAYNKGRRSKIRSENECKCIKYSKKTKGSKNKFPNGLDPNEGAGDLRKIKKKGIHRQSRTTSAKAYQSNDSSKKIHTGVAQIPRIVEQPRYPFIDPKNWQGVKIGSNFDFNIEFYKETVLPHNLTTDAGHKHTNYSKINNSELQPQKLINEKKVSTAGKALKKYFGSCQCKHHENIVTVGRVDKVITMSPFKSKQYYVYQIKQHDVSPDVLVKRETKTDTTKFYNKKHLNLEPNYGTAINKKENVAKDIKTILPFTPRKFYKNRSNTFFSRNGIAKGAKKYCCSYRPNQDQNCKAEIEKISKKSEIPSISMSKHIILTGKEKKIKLSRPSAVAVLKKIICMKFSKHRDTKRINPKCNPNNNNTSIKSIADVLKTSKSDRCPEKCLIDEPKKSKSLKNTVKAIKKRGDIDHQKKCYSRLQSGDAKSGLIAASSDKSLNCHCQKCIFSRPLIGKDSKCKAAVLYLQHENKSNDPNDLTKNVRYSVNPVKPDNMGLFFKCARKLSKCKDKLMNSHFSFIHSGDRKSCSVCKYKNTNKPFRNKPVVYYNRQLKGQFSANAKESKKNKKVAIQTGYKTNVKISVQKLSHHRKHNKKDHIAKLGTTVDMLCSTKSKREVCPASNLIKNNPRPKKKSSFDSSLFIKASMRKKSWPYYFCPWFYPHCLRMLNIWKHITDVVLFLLAVVVWSPCILIVEGFRAARCCTCMS